MTSFESLPVKEQERITSCLPSGSTFIGAECTDSLIFVTYALNDKIERFSYKGTFTNSLRKKLTYIDSAIIPFVTSTGEVKFAAENSPYFYTLFDKYHLSKGKING
jgi:hypothetical protein